MNVYVCVGVGVCKNIHSILSVSLSRGLLFEWVSSEIGVQALSPKSIESRCTL